MVTWQEETKKQTAEFNTEVHVITSRDESHYGQVVSIAVLVSFSMFLFTQ